MSGFVVVPAHYGLSGEDRGLEPGAAILAKPFSGSRLLEKVREGLGAGRGRPRPASPRSAPGRRSAASRAA